jgi:hypothetical protein
MKLWLIGPAGFLPGHRDNPLLNLFNLVSPWYLLKQIIGIDQLPVNLPPQGKSAENILEFSRRSW